MYKSLYSKIILILVVFIITVMCVVGVVLINNIYNYYSEDFTSQMTGNFSEGSQLYGDLEAALANDDYLRRQKEILLSYSSLLGIDSYRNFYILDENGNLLDSSDTSSVTMIEKTPNLLGAMNGKSSGTQNLAAA